MEFPTIMQKAMIEQAACLLAAMTALIGTTWVATNYFLPLLILTLPACLFPIFIHTLRLELYMELRKVEKMLRQYSARRVEELHDRWDESRRKFFQKIP